LSNSCTGVPTAGHRVTRHAAVLPAEGEVGLPAAANACMGPRVDRLRSSRFNRDGRLDRGASDTRRAKARPPPIRSRPPLAQPRSTRQVACPMTRRLQSFRPTSADSGKIALGQKLFFDAGCRSTDRRLPHLHHPQRRHRRAGRLPSGAGSQRPAQRADGAERAHKRDAVLGTVERRPSRIRRRSRLRIPWRWGSRPRGRRRVARGPPEYRQAFQAVFGRPRTARI